MRMTKKLCLAVTLTLAVSVVTATAASAESTPLPDIHTALPGESYPLALSGSAATGKGEVEDAGGTLLQYREASVSLSLKELTSLGEVGIVFLGMKEVVLETKCRSPLPASEEQGEVVFPNAEWHLVYTALSPTERLELGVLISFTKFAITCNAGLFELTFTGPWLVRLNVPTPEAGKGGDSTDIELASKCAGDTPELPYYYNDALERIATTLLLDEEGMGNKPGCWALPTVLLTPKLGSLSTMFSVLF
jgi:hypothetical protein